uniref:Uncharacterized protein n=1 Tax=Rhizophora mucronata TaxID=61149 RepID=A0A2P2PEN0_RHIMU
MIPVGFLSDCCVELVMRLYLSEKGNNFKNVFIRLALRLL